MYFLTSIVYLLPDEMKTRLERRNKFSFNYFEYKVMIRTTNKLSQSKNFSDERPFCGTTGN